MQRFTAFRVLYQRRDSIRSLSSTVNLPEVDEFGRSYGTGRRKTSVARVWLKEGSGLFTVNEKRLCDYFQGVQKLDCLDPLLRTKQAGLYDVWCTVKGGGMSGKLSLPLITIVLVFYRTIWCYKFGFESSSA